MPIISSQMEWLNGVTDLTPLVLITERKKQNSNFFKLDKTKFLTKYKMKWLTVTPINKGIGYRLEIENGNASQVLASLGFKNWVLL